MEICNFSGYKIYPGRGKLYVRGDSKSFRLLNGKCEAHFLAKLNNRKFLWTQVYRKLNKKGITEEVTKKRSRKAVKMQRTFVGASADQIKAKRNQSADVRKALRDKVLAEAKAKKKDEQAKKRAEKAKVAAARPAAKPVQSKAPKAMKNRPNKR